VNERIALIVTRYVGTMWCAYAFLFLAMLPVFVPSTEIWVQYTSSAVLQLILLPLIMVGQALEGRAAEQRAVQDHAAIMEILKEIRSGSVCHVARQITSEED